MTHFGHSGTTAFRHTLQTGFSRADVGAKSLDQALACFLRNAPRPFLKPSQLWGESLKCRRRPKVSRALRRQMVCLGRDKHEDMKVRISVRDPAYVVTQPP